MGNCFKDGDVKFAVLLPCLLISSLAILTAGVLSHSNRDDDDDFSGAFAAIDKNNKQISEWNTCEGFCDCQRGLLNYSYIPWCAFIAWQFANDSLSPECKKAHWPDRYVAVLWGVAENHTHIPHTKTSCLNFCECENRMQRIYAVPECCWIAVEIIDAQVSKHCH